LFKALRWEKTWSRQAPEEIKGESDTGESAEEPYCAEHKGGIKSLVFNQGAILEVNEDY
jgi:hypothetical protein